MGMLHGLYMGWGCPLVSMDKIDTLLLDEVKDSEALLPRMSAQVVWDPTSYSIDTLSIFTI